MQKSVLVAVDRWVRNFKYQVTLKKTSKIMAHDELNQCNIGDKVTIIMTRPRSKRKAWEVAEILHRAPVYDKEGEVAKLEKQNLAFPVSFAAAAILESTTNST